MPHSHSCEPPEPTRHWPLVFCLQPGTVRGHLGGNAAKITFYDIFLEELEACGMRLPQAGMECLCGWTWGLEKQHVLSVGAILVGVGVAWHVGKGRWPLQNSGGLLQGPQLLRAGEEEDVTWATVFQGRLILVQKRRWHFGLLEMSRGNSY